MKWERYIKDFAGYLKIERGLSENSIEAYIRDVRKLADSHSTKSPKDLNRDDLKEFIAVLFDFVERMEFDRLGIFTYSHEENTHAYNFEDDVPEDVKKGACG